mmetsp:Transcript_38514/g.84648  ORF Transcript_38514/g.84648 Transcript_38514/m.84648 type:complete len:126 (-) Transcript_38514:341-718(-)
MPCETNREMPVSPQQRRERRAELEHSMRPSNSRQGLPRTHSNHRFSLSDSASSKSDTLHPPRPLGRVYCRRPSSTVLAEVRPAFARAASLGASLLSDARSTLSSFSYRFFKWPRRSTKVGVASCL